MSSTFHSRAYLDAISASDKVRQITDTIGGTLAQREYEKSMARTLSARTLGIDAYGLAHARDISALQSMSAMQDAVNGIAMQQRLATAVTANLATQSVMDSFGGPLAMREYAKVLDLASQVKKLNFGFEADYAHREAMKALENAAAASKWIESAGSIAANLEYANISGKVTWVDQVSKSLVDDGLYKRFMETLDIRHSVPSELWSKAAEIAERRYEKLFESSTAWASQIEQLQRPGYLDTLLHSLEREVSAEAYPSRDFFVDEDTENDDEALLQALGTAETPERFAEVLAKCSKWLKWALLKFMLYVMLPLAISISANLAMPHVEQYLKQNTAVTQRVQAKEIKQLSMGDLRIALRDCRFVTATTLALRGTPNARAKQIDTMRFGQVVTVISIKADWTEISYEYGDGQVVTGWVFTRYLEKFRR